jgi:hypothetical protein
MGNLHSDNLRALEGQPARIGSRSETLQMLAESVCHCHSQPTTRDFLHEVSQMPVSVGRQVLKTLKNDRGADFEVKRYPKPAWVGQTEQGARER